jgi:GNAT superfamily N-acetyltransferase
MISKTLRNWQRLGRRMTRRLFAAMPSAWRFGLYRRAIDFAPVHASTLELKIADTQEELEQCFALLHDAYVASGFMRPHPSGLRVTPYHALPTTTTLCAKVDGQVVGTLSIVREGVFGFPMQTAFDISSVRAKEGRIAEISALAIHPRYRKTGGSVLFPLMKFMYEYCSKYFDTRHLLIAVNPNHIEMYESLLFFRRRMASTVTTSPTAHRPWAPRWTCRKHRNSSSARTPASQAAGTCTASSSRRSCRPSASPTGPGTPATIRC